jgi:arsenite-transporting ATPase
MAGIPVEKTSRDVTMFCGKGGVGKTTSAAATALNRAAAGKKTLVVSTDFTPSLRDIFEVDSAEKPARVTDNLYLDEISYGDVKALWEKKFGPQVYDVFSAFVDIEYGEFTSFVATILPGIRDEFMVDYIREISESGRFESIVWDTAPAGQTLGLLRMPSLMNHHLKPAARIYSSLKATPNMKRSVLGVIREWQELSDRDMDFLRRRVEFNIVTIAEALAVRQLDDLFGEFSGYGLTMDRLIVNQVVEKADSPFLESKARMQQGYLAELKGRYGLSSCILPLLPYEVKGIERIREVERRLFGQIDQQAG